MDAAQTADFPTVRVRSPLAGRRILVTGGTTGIGRETVLLLVRCGARVLTFGRACEPLAQTLQTASALGEVHGLTADVSRRKDVEEVFDAVDAKLGGLDALVACAALGAEPLHEMEEDDWRYVVDTNLVGALACTRQAVKRMQGSGGGQVIVVGSVSSAFKAPGESVYAATKGGLEAFVQTLRKEVARDNIRVGLMQPGAVATPMQPASPEEQAEAVKRQEMLQAEEIAEGIVFMLTRSAGCDVVQLRMEPLIQETG